MPDLPIGLLASLLVRSVRQLVVTQVEPLGLSTQQFWALVAIAEHSTSSQAELAARLRVDEASACRVVRALSEAGLVTALRDPSDRRRVRLKLSSGGETLSRRLVPVAQDIRSAIDAALSPEERSATRLALGKVVARLSALTKGIPASPADPPAANGLRSRGAAILPARTREAARRSPSPVRGTP